MVGTAANCRPLFGGAILTSVPHEFADISQIREVPDNQEVFARADTDQSLIVELLEMKHPLPEGDSYPASFHFSVLASDAGAIESQLFAASELNATDFPLLTTDDPNVSVTLAYGMHIVSKFRDDASKANRVGIYLACVRLPRAKTDLVIVFNDPVMLHPESSSTKLGSSVANPTETSLPNRAAILRSALAALRIKDWNLLV